MVSKYSGSHGMKEKTQKKEWTHSVVVVVFGHISKEEQAWFIPIKTTLFKGVFKQKMCCNIFLTVCVVYIGHTNQDILKYFMYV